MWSGGVIKWLNDCPCSSVEKDQSTLTVLTEAATEALRTGALCGGAVRDLDADSSVVTGVGPTRTADSARRVDRNWWQRQSQWQGKKIVEVKNMPNMIINSPSGWLLLGWQKPSCRSRSKLWVSEHLKRERETYSDREQLQKTQVRFPPLALECCWDWVKK